MVFDINDFLTVYYGTWGKAFDNGEVDKEVVEVM